MSTTEHGFEAGSAPDEETPEEKSNPTKSFEEMFSNEPWLHGYSMEAIQARGMARETYANYLLGVAKQEELRASLQNNLGQVASAEMLQEMAVEQFRDEEFRDNDDPDLPLN